MPTTEELKNIIREELAKVLAAGSNTRANSDAPAPAPEEKKKAAPKDSTRQKKNQEVIARWLRNQEMPQLRFGGARRRYGVKVGSKPWHKTGEDETAKGHHAFGENKGAEPKYNLIPQPKNPSLLLKFLRATSARLGVWRAGVRPLTKVVLDFQADHAIAKSAVYEEYPKDKVQTLGLLEVQSQIKNKEEFLLRPDLGRQLAPESAQIIASKCIQNPDVQIVVSDGLSGLALEVNAEKLLPELTRVLQAKGYSLGTPVYCKYGRVQLQDRIGEIVKAKTCVILIGERPGLGTGDGLSAYLIYQPNSESTHANRNCISNIHPRGLDPVEAAKYIEFTLTKMFEQKTSGVDLDLT